MKMNILMMGNDLNIQQLLVDILEITFDDIIIERAHTIDTLFQKLAENEKKYNLIIINSTSNKELDESLIHMFKINYGDSMDRLLFIFSSTDEKPSESLLADIAFVSRPFSLDVIGDAMKRLCLPAEIAHEKR